METVGNRDIPTVAEWKQHLAGPDTICGSLYQLMDDLATLIPTAGTATTFTTSALTFPGNITTTANVTFTLGSTEAFTLNCTDISAPLVMTNTVSTAGKTGCRALFHTITTAKLGGWANALKGYFECGSGGDITGLASGICAEFKMPNASISGTMCVLEIELVDQANSAYGSGGSFIRAEVSGTKTAFNQNGYLLDLQGLSDTANGLFDATNVDDPDFTHALRIRIGTTDFFIGLSTNVSFNA
jgi:hypothetical protein